MEFTTQFQPVLQDNYMELGYGNGFPTDVLSSEEYLEDVYRNKQFHADGSYVDYVDSQFRASHCFNEFEPLDTSNFYNFDPALLEFQCFLDFPPTITPSIVMPGVMIGHGMNTCLNFEEPELSRFASSLEQIACVTAQNRFWRKMVMVKKKLSRNVDNAADKVDMIKGHWAPEEDRFLKHLVDEHGKKNWSLIAEKFKGRTGKQCRNRWLNHLRPNITKAKWTEEEENIIIKTHAEIGNRWAEMAKRMNGRPENSIKNYWNATKRKLLSRRKSQNSNAPKTTSLLENYISSLYGTPKHR